MTLIGLADSFMHDWYFSPSTKLNGLVNYTEASSETYLVDGSADVIFLFNKLF